MYVVDQHESLQRGEDLPLKVTLSHYVSATAAAPGVLVMDPVAPKISNGGKCVCVQVYVCVTLKNGGLAYRLLIECTPAW